MQPRSMARPTLVGMPSLSNSQASVSIRSSQQEEEGRGRGDGVLASYIVSDSGAKLTLGGAYQVSSTGTREMNPVTGSTTAVGKGLLDGAYELGLAASQHSALKCNHISELDFDNGRLIGRGSSGRVYNVVHKPSGVCVCVKQMQLDDHRHREEVKRELDSLHKAASRFIVDFYGAFFHNEMGVILLVLELMECSMADIMKARGTLREREVKAIAYQVVLGLQFLHTDRQLLHRDIKPANLLLHRGGFVKIADFGVSTGGSESHDAQSVHTFVGSISYMSPERLNAQKYSFEADIWSLGVILCEAMTGSHPYASCGDSGSPPQFWDLLHNIKEAKGTRRQSSPLKSGNAPPEISDEMDKFVAKCLTISREERSTADELLEDPWLSSTDLEESEAVVREIVVEYIGSKMSGQKANGEDSSQPTALNNSLMFQGASSDKGASAGRDKSSALLAGLMASVK